MFHTSIDFIYLCFTYFLKHCAYAVPFTGAPALQDGVKDNIFLR